RPAAPGSARAARCPQPHSHGGGIALVRAARPSIEVCPEAGAGAFSALSNLGLRDGEAKRALAATRAHVGVGAARPRPRRCRAVRSATSYAPITSPAHHGSASPPPQHRRQRMTQ
ncbi:MAG TPA: hypothetical protein VG389_02210, partial [Myxococcota bacterium]|nr:hypothetical protein [Myxococcota bacterium]